MRQIKLSSNGLDTTIYAGTGSQGFSGDNGPATSALLSSPKSCDVGIYLNSRVMLIADYGNHRIREIYDNGGTFYIRTVAGTGNPSYSTGTAVNSHLNNPTSAIYDLEGNIYIMDLRNYLIRKITRITTGNTNNVNTDQISNYAGTQGSSGGGNNGDSNDVTGNVPVYIDYGYSLDINEQGDIYLTELYGYSVRKITASNSVINTVLGGQSGNENHGSAIGFQMNSPYGIAVVGSDFFVTDLFNSRIVKYTASNSYASTVAVTYVDNGDGINANDNLEQIYGLYIDRDRGVMYVALTGKNDVKVLDMLCDAGYYTSTGNAEHDQNEGRMSCTACGMGEYGTTTGETECKKCISGTYNPVEASVGTDSCLVCTAGSYCPEGTGQPIACPAGTYSSATGGTSSNVCIVCPLGSECPVPATLAPTLCRIGYYSDVLGSSSCMKCPNGRLSLAGSDAAEDCVNPVPNFLIGLFALITATATIVMYVTRGRFRRIAFLRKYRALNLILYECRSVENSLLRHIMIFHVHENFHRYRFSWKRQFKAITWMLVSTFIVLVAALLYYVMIMVKIEFDILIVWKNIAASDSSFIAKLQGVEEAFNKAGVTFLSRIISPFAFIIEYLSTFSLNLDTLEVTCVGSQAGPELLVNCAVLGFVIAIIESDFQLYQNMVFERLNMKIVRAIFTYNLKIDYREQTVVICALFVIFSEMRPVDKILQLLMSLLNFRSFVSDKQYYLAHAKTDACNSVQGVPNMDSFIAYTTSALFWYMMIPAFYTIASVCVPYGDNVPEEHRVAIKEKLKDDIEIAQDEDDDDIPEEFKSAVPVLKYNDRMCPAKLAENLTQKEFTEVVEMFDECDTDNSGTIDYIEMEKLFLKMGITASHEKTQRVFEAADQDGGGEIDFDEFCNFIVMFKKEDATGFKYFASAFDKGSAVGNSGFLRLMKLSSFIMPDLIILAADMAWLNELTELFNEQIQFHWKQIITAPLRSETHEEHAAWVDERSSAVPTYFRLCHQCFDELYKWSLGLFCIEDIVVTSKNTELDTLVTHDGRSKPITKKRTVTQHKHVLRWKIQEDDDSVRGTLRMEDIEQKKWSILCISHIITLFLFTITFLLPIGHLFTDVGRAIWSIIFRKYYVFMMVCSGFWTDDAVHFYDLKQAHVLEVDEYINLEKHSAEYTDEDIDLDKDSDSSVVQAPEQPDVASNSTKRKFSILSSAMHKDDIGIDWENTSKENVEEAVDLEMHGAVEVITGTRAVIIQIIPYLTIFSIFAVGVSHAPIYCSDKAKQYFSPFVIKNAFERAILREKAEANHTYDAHKRGVMWVVWLKSLMIFLKESRLVQACVGYLKFFLTLGLLFASDLYPWIILSIILFIPISAVSMLEIFIYTGRFIGIVDEDLMQLYHLFGITLEPRDTSDFEEAIPYKFGDAGNIILGQNLHENERAVQALIKENKKLKIDLAAIKGYRVDKNGNPLEDAMPLIDDNHPESPKKGPLLL